MKSGQPNRRCTYCRAEATYLYKAEFYYQIKKAVLEGKNSQEDIEALSCDPRLCPKNLNGVTKK